MLSGLGAAGVFSLLLWPFARSLAEANGLTGAAIGLTLVQPALLTALAVFAGAKLAPRVGLGAPLIEAQLQGGEAGRVLRWQLPAAAAGGAFAGIVLIGYARLSGGIIENAAAMAPPLATRLLYGGVAEEVMMRWGLMTAAVWGLSTLSRGTAPPASAYWGGIVIAALLFAIGHLPALFLMDSAPNPTLLAAVLIGNSAPGIVFGWLYWRRGIEAAMLAHGFAHLVGWAAGA